MWRHTGSDELAQPRSQGLLRFQDGGREKTLAHNLVPRVFSSTIFKMAARREKALAKAEKISKNLGDFYHVTFKKKIQNGGKASRENQNSGQNTYLKTCKLYARDIDSYVVRWNIIFSDVWNLEHDFCAVKVRV